MSTILVVEDDSRIQKALQRLFTAEGYEVKVRREMVLPALRSSKVARLDAVVLDLMLPGLSGRELCKIDEARLAGYSGHHSQRCL
jgi:DNA-binding response OmpR family regulator